MAKNSRTIILNGVEYKKVISVDGNEYLVAKDNSSAFCPSKKGQNRVSNGSAKSSTKTSKTTTPSEKAKPSKKAPAIDWAELPVRKTLKPNEVAHRAINKTLKGLKGEARTAAYNALWNSWKEFRDAE